MFKRTVIAATVVFMCGLGVIVLGSAGSPAGAGDSEKVESPAPATAEADKVKWVSAVDPKPLSQNVKRGLGWLVEHQLASGAWGQGEESQSMGGGSKLKDTPSVADTCLAALALIRSGSTPAKGPYAASLDKAVNFVCSEIEKSDKDSLYITATRNTRVQGKLGTYIDTFMASMLLPEVQDKMPDDKGQERASAALDKVLHKMTKNQRANGTWDDRGWAPTLAQAMATKGLNRAAQSGREVEDIRARAEKYASAQFDKKTGKFSSAGSAGVSLYTSAGNLGATADSANTNAQLREQARKDFKEATTQAARDEAKAKLDRYNQTDDDLAEARKAVVAKLEDKQFIAGFGSNGGEEFLSYMNIGEALVVAGGANWKKWDLSITRNLNKIQNKDGSWTGHHCITGRTFCTSAALLVLMVDRTPVPLAAKMGRR